MMVLWLWAGGRYNFPVVCRLSRHNGGMLLFAVMLAASSVLRCNMSYGWQCCLVLCSVSYVWRCHMAGRVTLLCSVSYFWLCQLLLCSVGWVWQCRLLLCYVSYDWQCHNTVQWAVSGSVILWYNMCCV